MKPKIKIKKYTVHPSTESNTTSRYRSQRFSQHPHLSGFPLNLRPVTADLDIFFSTAFVAMPTTMKVAGSGASTAHHKKVLSQPCTTTPKRLQSISPSAAKPLPQPLHHLIVPVASHNIRHNCTFTHCNKRYAQHSSTCSSMPMSWPCVSLIIAKVFPTIRSCGD